MKRRIDFSDFDPQGHREKATGDLAVHKAAIRLEGFWGTHILPIGLVGDGRDVDPSALSYWLRANLTPLGGDYHSLALVDWTSLFHVAQLFAGNLQEIDPFVALADLNAVLAASLFYDRVVVIDGQVENVSSDAGSALGLTDVLVTLPSSGGPKDAGGHSVFEWTFTHCFQGAAAQLQNEHHDSGLRTDLRQAWSRMLPNAQQPLKYEVEKLHWSKSPQRPDLHRQLFERTPTERWEPRAREQMIIDNDVRALSYERLASVMTGALSEEDRSGPNVRYIGGVLRAPMQFAMRRAWHRAWGAADDATIGPAAEATLNAWWSEHQASGLATPAFPFWFAAILDECRSRDSFAKAVQKWRSRAANFRRHRAEFEAALAEGNLTKIEPFKKSIIGAIGQLPEAGVAKVAVTTAGAAAGAGLALTGVPVASETAGAAVEQAAPYAASPVARWLLRASRPQLWFVARAGDVASRQLLTPQRRASEVFGLPAGDKEYVDRFLRNVNELEWAV